MVNQHCSSCTVVEVPDLGVEPSMIYQDNPRFMGIILLFHLRVVKEIRDPCDCAKVVHFGGIGCHGKLLVVFGFWILVCRVSNFVRRYSGSGFFCPHGQNSTVALC